MGSETTHMAKQPGVTRKEAQEALLRSLGRNPACPRRKRPCLYAQIRLLIVLDASKALFPVWGAEPFVLSSVFIRNSQQYPPALLAETRKPCYNAAMEQDTPKG